MYGLQKIAAAKFDEVIKNMPLEDAFNAVKKTYRKAIKRVPIYRQNSEQKEMTALLSTHNKVSPQKRNAYYKEVLSKYKKPLRKSENFFNTGGDHEYNRGNIPASDYLESDKENILYAKKHRKHYTQIDRSQGDSPFYVRFGGTEEGPNIKSFTATHTKNVKRIKNGKVVNQPVTKNLHGVTVSGGFSPEQASSEIDYMRTNQDAIDGYRDTGSTPHTYLGRIDPKHIVGRGGHYVIPKENLKHLEIISKEKLPLEPHPYVHIDKLIQKHTKRYN